MNSAKGPVGQHQTDRSCQRGVDREKMVGFRNLYNNIYRENDKGKQKKRMKAGYKYERKTSRSQSIAIQESFHEGESEQLRQIWLRN